jgi:hypothetical protein
MALTVTPLPTIGDVVAGRDVAGRELRISGHPESDRVVLSIWQFGECLATVRLARADVPEVTRALVAGLVPTSSERDQDATQNATVHRLPERAGRSGPAPTLSDRLGGGLREFGRRLRGFDPRD